MITAVTAQTAQGRLYEADMRLRPSGNQGPVATSWPAFQSYQRNDAWYWEHLALTRARPVAGAETLATDIEAFRCDILAAPRKAETVLQDLSEMRARIATAKAPGSVWDVKIGPGRLQDIELLSQTGALLRGTASRDIDDGLDACADAGVLSAAEAAALADAYRTISGVQMAARLLSTGPLNTDDIGTGGQSILLRATQTERIEDSEARLADIYDTSAAIIDAALEKGQTK